MNRVWNNSKCKKCLGRGYWNKLQGKKVIKITCTYCNGSGAPNEK